MGRRVIVALVAAAGMAFIIWSIWDRETIAAWMQYARPLPFFVAMAILPALGAPMTPFFVVAGATFGVAVGLIGSGVALLLNLALCYWIARSSLRPWLESLLRRWSHELPDFTGRRREALRFSAMVKMAPGIPAFVKHYGLAMAGVPFEVYLGMSFLITGTYAAALLVLGDSLLDHDIGRALIVSGAAAVLLLAFWWWRRRRSNIELQPDR